MPFSLTHFKNKFWKLNSIHWLRTEHIKAWLNAIIHLVLPFFSATTLNKAALRLTSHNALKSFCSMRSSSLLSLVTMVAWRGVLSRMDSPKAVPIPRVQMVTASWEPQKPVVRKVDILSADEFFSQKWTVDPWTMWELGVPTPSRSISTTWEYIMVPTHQQIQPATHSLLLSYLLLKKLCYEWTPTVQTHPVQRSTHFYTVKHSVQLHSSTSFDKYIHPVVITQIKTEHFCHHCDFPHAPFKSRPSFQRQLIFWFLSP